MAVAPEHRRRAAPLRPQNLADQIEDEVHLAAIGMITRPVERRRNQAQIAQPKLPVKRLEAGIEHPLGHGVGEQAVDRLAFQVVLFDQLAIDGIGAARSHGDQLGLRLAGLPPGENICIDLLIDDPLLAGVVQAEVARLGPGREVINLVIAAIVE